MSNQNMHVQTRMLIWRKRVILNQTRSKYLANSRLLSGSGTLVDRPTDGVEVYTRPTSPVSNALVVHLYFLNVYF